MKPLLLQEALTCFSNLRNDCASNSWNTQYLYHIIEHLIVFFFLVMLALFSGWLVFHSYQIANPLRPGNIWVCIELNETFKIILYNLFHFDSWKSQGLTSGDVTQLIEPFCV